MGSGDWFKNIISLKKGKDDRSKKSKGSSGSEKTNGKNYSQKESTKFANGTSNGKPRFLGLPVEDVAAIRIQTAFISPATFQRGGGVRSSGVRESTLFWSCTPSGGFSVFLVARKNLRRLKGIVRLQILTQTRSVSKQTSTTLSYLHSWSRTQAQLRARRLSMVTEGRIRQKKLENQLKLEAKLQDLEADWCGGSETMDEILARIHQREEAAVKRERALAYAFSHQWRANSNSILGPPELGTANWGWSWMERWIAARPWESRVPIQSSPKKPQSQLASKSGKNTSIPTMKAPVAVKTISLNGKGPTKARRMSYPAAEKPAPQSIFKTEEAKIEERQVTT
ncbi:unnamed protein product [Camellia sinensis]